MINSNLPQEAKTARPHLSVHEWMAVVAIIIFLGTLTICIVLAPQQETGQVMMAEPHFIADQKVEVIIQGAVEHPGVYTLTRGMLVSDLLEQAIPLAEADVKRVKLDKKLRTGQVIKVPEIKMITIQLTGAVQPPHSLRVPKGTRVQDLLEKVKFQEEADLSKLRKKRLLKDGEIIHVPALMPLGV